MRKGISWAVVAATGLMCGAACAGDDQEGRVGDVAEAEVEDTLEGEALFDVDADDPGEPDGEPDSASEVASEVELDVAAEVEVDVAPETIEDVAETIEVAPEVIDCGDCDDGLDCTNDVCGADGVCMHHIRAGTCRVAGECMEAGEGPAQCLVCAPDIKADGLTALTGGTCDDGDPCTDREQCNAGLCDGGVERPCEASSVCHVSLGCDAALGCVEEGLPDGTVCGNGLVCDALECKVGDGMLQGTIAWFDLQRCPVGWEPRLEAIGRTLVPVGPNGPVGGVWEDGAPLENAAEVRHTHSVSGSVDVQSQSFAGIAGGGNGLAASGTRTFSATTSAASLGLPYLQLLACEKTSDVELGPAPTGVFVFAEHSFGCPADWIGSDEGADRLVVGNPEGGSAGATFGAPPGLAVRPAHTHTIVGTIPVGSHGIALVSGCCSGGFASSADRPVSLTSSGPSPSDAVIVPWRAELQCMAPPAAPGTPPGDTEPPGIVLFASGVTCPVGWVVHEPARGRLILGSAEGGDVGLTVGTPLGDREDRRHSHSVTLGFTLERKNIAAANGGNHDGAVFGTHDGTFTTSAATSGLPFRQLLACRKP